MTRRCEVKDMPDEKKDFELEVLAPALQERMKKKDEYIDKPLEMQGKLLGSIAAEVIARFGDEGREAIIAGVRRYGEERGRRLAERVKSEGREPDFASFTVCSDLDTGYHRMEPHMEEGRLRVEVSYCPLAQALKEWGLEEYGKYFCRNIDAAIMRGYNPERYETVCERNLTEGAETCTIIYRFKED